MVSGFDFKVVEVYQRGTKFLRRGQGDLVTRCQLVFNQVGDEGLFFLEGALKGFLGSVLFQQTVHDELACQTAEIYFVG